MKIVNIIIITTSLLIAGCYVWPTMVRTTQPQVMVDHHRYTTYQNCTRCHYGYYDSYRYYRLPYSYYYRYQRPAIDKPTVRKNDRTRLRNNDGNRTPQNNNKPQVQTRERQQPPRKR